MDILANINRREYSRRSVARSYGKTRPLQAPEKVILNRIEDGIRDKPILDIGVGGGRTASVLVHMTSEYVGIDYSPEMVRICKARFPMATIYCQDARDLSLFPDSHFSLVLFSFNGIDYVSQVGRLRILREVTRILSIGGYFVFSSHNRDFSVLSNSVIGTLPRPMNARRLLGWIVYLPTCTLNHARLRRYETSTEEYAIVNDGADYYSFLAYKIGIEEQLRQLRRAGFSDGTEAYDIAGRKVLHDTTSPWIYYIARK